MAETPNPATPPAASKGGASGEAFEAAKSAADGAARQAKEGARAAETAVDKAAGQVQQGVAAAEAVARKTAEAGQAAAKANTDILRGQIETAQQAARSGLEVGMRSFQGLTQNWKRVFGVTANPDLAAASARNVRAVSEASTALAKGAQDASRAWLELTQKSVRTNLEALSQLANVRSVQELMALQSNLVRNNLQSAIESSEAIARASTDAIREATRAIQPNA